MPKTFDLLNPDGELVTSKDSFPEIPKISDNFPEIDVYGVALSSFVEAVKRSAMMGNVDEGLIHIFYLIEQLTKTGWSFGVADDS